MTPVTDYMVLASGTSDRHVKAIAQTVAYRAKEAGETLLGTESRLFLDVELDEHVTVRAGLFGKNSLISVNVFVQHLAASNIRRQGYAAHLLE